MSSTAILTRMRACLAALTDRVEEIEEILNARTPVSLIDSDGNSVDVTVFKAENAATMLETVNWIDGVTGLTMQADILRWNPDTIVGSVWRDLYWLAQDGRHWAARVLMDTSTGLPAIADAPTGGTAGGAVIGTLYNREDVKDCAGDIFDILKAAHED